ncbi:hypothetical protein HY947_03370 [Candidatus Gottesmanbacteria bacterium]|nr:hypothetical protein [Candidatus Gottesmanbacteria bacterium]
MSKEIYTTADICNTIHRVATPILGADHLFLPMLDKRETAQIFRWINSLDDMIKFHLLQEMFSSKGFGIPNGRQVANAVYNSLDIIHSVPIHEPNESSIQTLVNAYLLRFNATPMSINVIHGDIQTADSLMYDSMTANSFLNQAKEKYRKLLEKTADSSGRREEFDLVSHIVYQGFSHTAGWAAVPATYAALHEVVSDVFVSDLFNHGNPNVPLVDLYRLGCQPIGAIDNDFIVYIPQNL